MKKIVTIVLVAIMAVAMFACAAPAPASEAPASEAPASEAPASEAPASEAPAGEAPAEGKKWKIVVMPKLVGIPYFNASEVGAIQAGKDLGVEVIYTGPTQGDAAEQVKMLEDLLNQGVDAICIAPNDPEAVSPVLQEAKKQGVVVISWDTPAKPDDIVYDINQIDTKTFAQLYFDQLVEKLGTDEGDYAIVTGGLNAANLNSWIDAGQEYAKEKYPKLNLVTDKVPTDESAQVSYQKSLDLLKAYPDLKAILGYSTPAPLGAAQAVQEKNLQDKVVVIGSSTPTDSGAYLEDGSLDAGLLWDPAKLGYLTVFAAKEVLEGRTLADKQSVENVGEISVNDKVVVMGPPSIWTKDNYKEFNF